MRPLDGEFEKAPKERSQNTPTWFSHGVNQNRSHELSLYRRSGRRKGIILPQRPASRRTDIQIKSLAPRTRPCCTCRDSHSRGASVSRSSASGVGCAVVGARGAGHYGAMAVLSEAPHFSLSVREEALAETPAPTLSSSVWKDGMHARAAAKSQPVYFC